MGVGGSTYASPGALSAGAGNTFDPTAVAAGAGRPYFRAWWTYTPAVDTRVTLDTYQTTTTGIAADTDTMIWIFTGTTPPTTGTIGTGEPGYLIHNDDTNDDPNPAPSDYMSKVEWVAEAGVTYHILMGNYNSTLDGVNFYVLNAVFSNPYPGLVAKTISWVPENVQLEVNGTELFTSVIVGSDPWDDNMASYTTTYASWDWTGPSSFQGQNTFTRAIGDIPQEVIDALTTGEFISLTAHLTFSAFNERDSPGEQGVIIIIGDNVSAFNAVNLWPEGGSRDTFRSPDTATHSYISDNWNIVNSFADPSRARMKAALLYGKVFTSTGISVRPNLDTTGGVTLYKLSFDLEVMVPVSTAILWIWTGDAWEAA